MQHYAVNTLPYNTPYLLPAIEERLVGTKSQQRNARKKRTAWEAALRLAGEQPPPKKSGKQRPGKQWPLS